jgi:ankyrin repeat protein
MLFMLTEMGMSVNELDY